MLKFILLFSISVGVTSYILQYFQTPSTNRNLFTSDQLLEYNGVIKPQLYLAILGNVFDVTKGAKYYGPGETYHGFIGRDNSRSFITGTFDDDNASDDVIGLSNQELRSLDHWIKFYKKEYKKIGKLIGKYYDKHGKLTPYGKEIKLLVKAAEQASATDDLEKLKFPPCNIEWDPQKGTRVWCTKKSGGIKREWIGVPRQYYEAGAESYRCACIKEDEMGLGNIKEYEGCDALADSCYVIINT